MTGSPLQRFWAKVAAEPNGCWRWTAATDPTTGYGKFHDGTTTVNAHRWAYLHFVGVPALPQLDHVCRNRWCVNPLHLEPVTHRTNQLRGDTFPAAHAEDRDCGHDGCKNCQRFRVSA